MAEKRRKKGRPAQNTHRRTISLPQLLDEGLEKLISEHGYTGASAYVQTKIRRDLGLEEDHPGS